MRSKAPWPEYENSKQKSNEHFFLVFHHSANYCTGNNCSECRLQNGVLTRRVMNNKTDAAIVPDPTWTKQILVNVPSSVPINLQTD